ncbi:hypothetical protein HYDPIDRAFT_29874 [Hydnomerulius pinastri MD-312]|uniref:Uncharacterized protein n=1 Tax=Hydnomerulius pinastri MD-312 TaxID=994086 RepID=A0A0C9W7K7_9AGAM|nr:hypothetical protein HYDPIDRAFT_29874 [Hydnomerulius pinastri MD-312]
MLHRVNASRTAEFAAYWKKLTARQKKPKTRSQVGRHEPLIPLSNTPVSTSDTVAEPDTNLVTPISNAAEELKLPAPITQPAGKKWQPRKAKSARQVNADGTAMEFADYWKRLKPDPKGKYEKDFATLVSNDVWNNFSTAVIEELSSGTMY